MKIARFDDSTGRHWGVVEVEDSSIRPVVGAFAEWAPALTRDPATPPSWADDKRKLADVRLLPPVPYRAKVVALGATFAKHVAGLGLEMAKDPAAFWKPYSCLIGHDEQIRYSGLTAQLDYEVELAAIIGTEMVDLDEAPLRNVLGYTIANDVSARDLQFGGAVTGMDTFSGKVIDGTSGMGPWIVTRDEFGDAHPDLELKLEVDGEVRQQDRTSSMVWGMDELLAWVVARTSLTCGDAYLSGTPAGVAYEDGRYLEPGQVVAATIEGIGTLENVVGAREPSP